MSGEEGRVPLAPGSREPDQQAVPALTGFDPSRAATEIGELINRIVKLAPIAGLYIGITVEPAKVKK